MVKLFITIPKTQHDVFKLLVLSNSTKPRDIKLDITLDQQFRSWNRGTIKIVADSLYVSRLIDLTKVFSSNRVLQNSDVKMKDCKQTVIEN